MVTDPCLAIPDHTAPRLAVAREGEATRVMVLNDTLTLQQIPALQTRLEAITDGLPRPRIILDLRSCHHMPTTAIGVFVSLHARIAHQNGELRIVTDVPRIHELFKITRLDRLFHLHHSVASAAESLHAVTSY